MFRLLLLPAVLLAVSLSAEPMMTLEEAIALGLKNSYNIKVARNQAQMADNNKGLGLAGFLPTVDASGGYRLTNGDLEIDLPPSSAESEKENLTAELSLRWTLFDGFRMFVDRKKFNELARMGEYQARNQIEGSIVNISRAYFNLVQQERLLQVASDTRDLSEARLRRERIRNELGGSSSTDFLHAQVAFNSDQSTLLSQQLLVNIARQQLNVLLGQDPATSYSVSNEILIPELSLDYTQVHDLALEHNSSLKAAELSEKITGRDVQKASSSFLPNLSAYANYGYSDETANSTAGLNPGLDVGTQTTSTTVGLSLSLNLFNGRRNRIELQNAKIEAVNQALVLRDARNRLIGLVCETFDTYHQRMEVITLEAQNAETAQQNLDLQKERQEQGIVNSLEFRDAQLSLTKAQTSLITARYQARISRLEIEQLIGSLEID
ncbi:MAG: TolC family protein [candidate division Zixibacteria bacterium]|nr:TolC family protein [candidate division Zixibacteria bacterium]